MYHLQMIGFCFNDYRCRAEYENRDEATKGNETTRKQFHAFVLFLAELYLNLEVRRKWHVRSFFSFIVCR